MHKAIIYYTNGTIHKLALPGVSLAEFEHIIDSNINGFPNLTVKRIARWIER